MMIKMFYTELIAKMITFTTIVIDDDDYDD